MYFLNFHYATVKSIKNSAATSKILSRKVFKQSRNMSRTKFPRRSWRRMQTNSRIEINHIERVAIENVCVALSLRNDYSYQTLSSGTLTPRRDASVVVHLLPVRRNDCSINTFKNCPDDRLAWRVRVILFPRKFQRATVYCAFGRITSGQWREKSMTRSGSFLPYQKYRAQFSMISRGM